MGENDQSAASDPARSRFVLLAVFIVLLGLLARVFYVLAAQVDIPIRGDSNEYVLYAWNLVHRGIYSMAMPNDPAATPSGYRAPGYPWLIDLMMRLAGHSDLPFRKLPDGPWLVLGYVSDTWMQYLMGVQVLLGTLTVVLSMAVARFWLRPGWCLLVGLMVALWPQSVAFCGGILSETLFSFSVMLAIWLCLLAQRRQHWGWMVAGGLTFGFAYLVNPVIILLPVFWAAGLCLKATTRSFGLGLLLAALIAPCAWAVARHADPPGQGSAQRAEITFVVGTWPDYYSAFAWRNRDASAAQLIEQATREQDVFLRDPRAGLAMIRARMADDPRGYLRWYLWEKPYLDWDWSIRMGGSDIAVPDTRNSPYEVYPSFRAMKWFFEQITPYLYWMSILVLLWLVVPAMRRRAHGDLPWLPAAVFVYVTAVHWVLQAEPRYSLPFRPIEFILAAWLLQQMVEYAQARRTRPLPA